MPGYILHLTAAKMYLDALPDTDPLRRCADLQNDFYIGNLLPDAVADKTESHFRDPRYLDRMVVWPRPEEFRRRYQDHMRDPVFRGYYFHLYIDKVFFSKYLPAVVEFLDKDGCETELRKEVQAVRLKKSGQMITLDQYLSEEYYYGDYTRMSSWLYEKYHLPEELTVPGGPCIEEMRDSDIRKVFTQLKEYRRVSQDAVTDLKVFDEDRLMRFLEIAAGKKLSEFTR